MIVVSCTLLHSDGTIEPKTFKVTESKLHTIQEKGQDQVDAFLRTKVIHKGYYGSWKRYGSWTLHDEPETTDSNANQCTYMYAWAYSRGTVAHTLSYNLNEQTISVYDDLLLLRVPDLNKLDIASSMAISNDQVNGWLHCICSAPISAKDMKNSNENKMKKKRVHRQKKTQKTNAVRESKQKKGKEIENTAVFEIEEESLLKDGDVSGHFKLNGDDEGDDEDDDDASCSEVGDMPTGTSNVSNGQSDDEEDENNDDDDDDDVLDGPIDTVLFADDDVDNVEDEDDDDEETGDTIDILEAQMLQYEDYDYIDSTISCTLPSLYSLWTTSSTAV